MSLFDYEISKRISGLDAPFYALIMAAYRQADTANAAKLRVAWPDVIAELDERYHAPGSLIASDRPSHPFAAVLAGTVDTRRPRTDGGPTVTEYLRSKGEL